MSCLKSVSQRDTAVSSQKRPKSVLDTDDPYHVACLVLENQKNSFKKGVIMWVIDNSRGQTRVEEAKKDQDKMGRRPKGLYWHEEI